jgi:drug/metabolite transporter (DMT)-like permease
MSAFFSLALIPSSLYTLLLYSYPAMVVVLSRLFGEPVSRVGAIALLLTVLGIALTVSIDERTLTGLLNAALYAGYILLSQHLLVNQRAVAHATRWSISGSFCVLALIALGNGLTLPQSVLGWVSVVGMGLICTVLPIFTFIAGIKRLGASTASILSSIEPLATLFLAVLLLGERLTWQQTVGGCLILASVLVIQLKPDRIARAA